LVAVADDDVDGSPCPWRASPAWSPPCARPPPPGTRATSGRCPGCWARASVRCCSPCCPCGSACWTRAANGPWRAACVVAGLSSGAFAFVMTAWGRRLTRRGFPRRVRAVRVPGAARARGAASGV